MTFADVANHLWQSTLCLAVAAGLVRLLRHNHARWRHLLWLAGSLKFLVPFSLLAALGANLPHPVVTGEPAVSVSMSFAAQAIGQPFTISESAIPDATPVEFGTATTPGDAKAPWPVFGVAVSIWAGGALLLFTGRLVGWWRFRAGLRAAVPVLGTREQDALARALARLGVRSPIRLLTTGTMLEPAVVGIVRPAMLWPVELSDRLSDRQLEAVFAHEVAHVRRRDNLAAALHRVVELVFWFYPVVWTLERRLLRERERACDEAVLHAGHEPRAYARAILKVSTFCLQSASGSVAGATGANLTKRMEDIMSAHIPSSMNAVRRTSLMSAAVAVIAGPLTVGYLQAAPWQIVLPAAGRPAAEYVGRTFRSGVPVAPMADLKVRPTSINAVAQTASRVSGVVTDHRGAPIADATVTATTSGGTSVKATTDANGRYVLDLQPAQYQMSAGKPGFRQTQSPLFVNRESPVTKDFQLEIGGVSESINVAGPDPTKTPTEYLDQARASYDQGRFADAERLMGFALARLRAENAARAAARAPAGTAASPSTYPPGMVRVGGDIKEPRKIIDVKPIYPPTAMASGVTGIVILEAVIGQDGGVIDARVLRGEPLLNQAALDAVTQWRFTPTTLNGAPVDVIMTVTVNFSLQ